MKRIIIGAMAMALVSGGVAFAADPGDTIKLRKNGMAAVGAGMGALTAMSKGEMPFNPKIALGALKAMNYVANTVVEHFPEGSGEGDTTAAPKIWEDKAGFEAAMAKFAEDTAGAIDFPPESQEDLGGVLGSIGGNCKSCHESYRIKK